MAPPDIIGYKLFDLYDAADASPTATSPRPRQQLELCGQPNGFTTGIAYRSDRPKETRGRQALQPALAQVGIKPRCTASRRAPTTPTSRASPNYVHSHDIGIAFGGWGADWPDGYGFLDEIINGNAISPPGNTNIAELNDPVVNSLFAQVGSPPTRRSPERRSGQIDMQVMKDAAILPERLRQVAALPEPGPDQRLRPALLRHVQLRRARREVRDRSESRA